MKVSGFVGSARKNGNTDILVQNVLAGVSRCGIETERIYLADCGIAACTGCEGCRTSFRCVRKDGMQDIYDKLEESDGIVLGSPTYFYNMSSLTKAWLERLYCYDIFDDSDRSVWLSLGEVTGIKYAVTVAVCEQDDAEDMGYTSPAMDKALQAVGFRVVESVKALHLYKKGDCENQKEILEKAVSAGEKLGKTILLADRVKKQLKAGD
ncbi:MAG TPA: flavodoxin family protein [Oscillospiraceae bacterium]|nr:flavodoxin family protein [Oscillospiraceae bacterium]